MDGQGKWRTWELGQTKYLSMRRLARLAEGIKNKVFDLNLILRAGVDYKTALCLHGVHISFPQ